MRARLGPTLWFVAGAVGGFSVAGLHSWLYLTLLPTFGFALILLALRIPGTWLWPVGAGLVVAIVWGLHITSGDTPDDEVWPVLVGLAAATLGVVMFLRERKKSQVG
ncbi:MAG TPA: hypothetical protein VJ927_06270 [Actinomycetota bacterium]|nr:hypothetical protein [Actinomycetota bacterium]